MVQHVNQSVASDAPSVSKDNIVDWIVSANTMLNTQSSSVAKSFKVCGLSNALDGTENGIIQCAKKLPHFKIPYGVSSEQSDEDIFADTDEEDDFSDEDDEGDYDEEGVDEE